MNAAKDERKTVTMRLGQKELDLCREIHQELNLTFGEVMIEAIRLFLFVARVVKGGGHLAIIEGPDSIAKPIVVPGLEWLKEKPAKGGG